MQSMKDAATNVTSSAKAGLEKTKATAQEQVEKMQSRDPLDKEMATRKKEGRVAEAEMRKLEERERAKFEHAAAGTGTTPGTAHLPTTEGVTGTHNPVGTTRVGLGGHNTRTGGAGTGTTGGL